jgi:hypothetical protein
MPPEQANAWKAAWERLRTAEPPQATAVPPAAAENPEPTRWWRARPGARRRPVANRSQRTTRSKRRPAGLTAERSPSASRRRRRRRRGRLLRRLIRAVREQPQPRANHQQASHDQTRHGLLRRLPTASRPIHPVTRSVVLVRTTRHANTPRDLSRQATRRSYRVLQPWAELTPSCSGIGRFQSRHPATLRHRLRHPKTATEPGPDDQPLADPAINRPSTGISAPPLGIVHTSSNPKLRRVRARANGPQTDREPKKNGAHLR